MERELRVINTSDYQTRARARGRDSMRYIYQVNLKMEDIGHRAAEEHAPRERGVDSFFGRRVDSIRSGSPMDLSTTTRNLRNFRFFFVHLLILVI